MRRDGAWLLQRRLDRRRRDRGCDRSHGFSCFDLSLELLQLAPLLSKHCRAAGHGLRLTGSHTAREKAKDQEKEWAQVSLNALFFFEQWVPRDGVLGRTACAQKPAIRQSDGKNEVQADRHQLSEEAAQGALRQR